MLEMTEESPASLTVCLGSRLWYACARIHIQLHISQYEAAGWLRDNASTIRGAITSQSAATR